MALEGIKQGAHLWFGLNRGAWLKLGFVTWLNEANLYYHPKLKIRIGVFADDTLIGYPAAVRNEYMAIKSEYAKIINIDNPTVICPALKFTGIQIVRDRREGTLTIHQTHYIEKLELEFKGRIKHQDTPYGVSKEQRTAFEKLIEDKSSPPVDKGKYLMLMGKLVWPSSMTRVDISMPVSSLCSCSSDPRQVHWDAGLVVMGYLVSTKSFGITYGGKLRVPYGLSAYPPGFIESSGLHCYHDSSFGTRPRPMGGYVIMYKNAAVDWAAKQVKIVPDSSCEAESAIGSLAAKATCFVRELLRFHHRPLSSRTPLITDNQALHSLIQQEGASVRTRYYERATLLIKRAVLLLILQPFLVLTEFMLADLFTKAVEKATFIKLRNFMMNRLTSLRSEIAAYVAGMHDEAKAQLGRLVSHL